MEIQAGYKGRCPHSGNHHSMKFVHTQCEQSQIRSLSRCPLCRNSANPTRRIPSSPSPASWPRARVPSVACSRRFSAGASSTSTAKSNAARKLRIHELFATHGEPHFRQIEADALRSVLEQTSAPTVIALGGGTFTESQNADLLRSHGAHVVFLELAVEELLQRCRAAGERSAHEPSAVGSRHRGVLRALRPAAAPLSQRRSSS